MGEFQRATNGGSWVAAGDDKDFQEFIELQKAFADSDQSWTVESSDLDTNSYDLTPKNPKGAKNAPLREPEAIIDEILALDTQSTELIKDVRGLL
jgi:type I restriction enzyme M protein